MKSFYVLASIDSFIEFGSNNCCLSMIKETIRISINVLMDYQVHGFVHSFFVFNGIILFSSFVNFFLVFSFHFDFLSNF